LLNDNSDGPELKHEQSSTPADPSERASTIDRAEAALAARLKARDPHAMGDCYDRYGRNVWSVVMAIVRNEGVAQDLTQDIFFHVWNRIQAFEANRPGGLGAWVTTIARNRAIDHLRSPGARIDRNSSQLDDREHPAGSGSTESELMNSDMARVIGNALAKLDPFQAKVIRLAYYEGLSQSEIAERLDAPLGTVKTWARTALKHLRERLGDAAK